MGAVLKHINCPKEWVSTDDYSSHRPLIWLAINSIPHDIFFEFGMGDGSTPLLKKWYKEINFLGKEYYSLENNKDWVRKNICGYKKNSLNYNSWLDKNHCVVYTNKFLDYSVFGNAILFIDCAPAEIRKDILIKNASLAHAIIIHDSEPGAEYVYGLKGALASFLHRIDYAPDGMPHTTIVSNKTDITKWIHQNSISYMTQEGLNGTTR